VIHEIEARATKWVQEHLSTHAVAISNATGATRDAYRRVQEQTNSPEPVRVELRANEKVATKAGDGSPLPSYERHLFADSRQPRQTSVRM
jgi:hypothetical protein